MLSKACQYAIKALIHISANTDGDGRVTLKDVAEAIDSPPAFTSKILQHLVEAKIITSVKGNKGGFEISQAKIKSTRLLTIIMAIEGDEIISGCFLGLEHCSDTNPCPVHNLYSPLRQQLIDNLYSVSLYDIIQGKDKYFLKE